jgi:hypothetical protein
MKKIIIVLTFLLIVPACRYKDGPLISFRRADKRMTGNWRLESLSINGEDKKQVFIDSIGEYFEINVDNDGTTLWVDQMHISQTYNTDTFFIVWLEFGQGGHIGNDFYTLSNTDQFDNYSYGYSFCRIDTNSIYPVKTLITITKLTNKKLWLEYNDDNGNNIMKLNKL